MKSLIDKQKQTRQKNKNGRLYCCFVDFKKAFDTVPRAVLWQVLERLGIQGPILDCIKSMYAQDSAAVRSPAGISEIFECLMGVKQGCPLSATLFGLYVDGLEQHLKDTVGHDAPSLSGILIPLLLYADDLILMSTSEAGLQKQLDALQQFCDQRQLSVNLTKTKIVTFGTWAQCRDFVFKGDVVERVKSYKYLGFEFHATKGLAFGVSKLVSAANKALHSMRRTCAAMYITDPAMQCQLFDTLVLPILSYASGVWGVDEKAGAAAEQLHRQFLKRMLGLRDSIADVIVLAECGRFPLQFHYWQQILRYHNRANKMSDTRLVRCAFLDDMQHTSRTYWSHKVQHWLQKQDGSPSIQQDLNIKDIIDNAKAVYASSWHQVELNSVARYHVLQPEYEPAFHLSIVRSFKSRRLISRFRCGCHGLHVDTGRLLPKLQQLPREQRHCHVCHNGVVEDEHHFLFDCPAYCSIRTRSNALFWGPAPSVSTFFALHDPRDVARFLRECFEHRNLCLSTQGT